jgi:hypothetical protein
MSHYQSVGQVRWPQRSISIGSYCHGGPLLIFSQVALNAVCQPLLLGALQDIRQVIAVAIEGRYATADDVFLLAIETAFATLRFRFVLQIAGKLVSQQCLRGVKCYCSEGNCKTERTTISHYK